MDSKLILALFCVVVVGVIHQAEAHGYMKDPAGRASAWRFGFKTPRNYEDDECNCGGFGNQWDRHNGECGLCGDPVQGPLRHQAGVDSPLEPSPRPTPKAAPSTSPSSSPP